jgi:secondary thiamine-phosphate synthase enzyme
MKQHHVKFTIRTRGRGLYEFTDRVEQAVQESGIGEGLCTLFCRHTSASLVIQENADPTVQTDLMKWLAKVAPDGDPSYVHNSEGPDDMAAHIRTMLTRTSETIPVVDGCLVLGTWQGIYLTEHRTAPHTRSIIIHLIGA